MEFSSRNVQILVIVLLLAICALMVWSSLSSGSPKSSEGFFKITAATGQHWTAKSYSIAPNGVLKFEVNGRPYTVGGAYVIEESK